MKPSRIFRAGWLLALLLMLALMIAPVRAQEPGVTETFDDPVLPGWEHSPGLAVVDGVLRIEPGGFAFHPGEGGDMALAVRVRFSGEGAVVISYRASDQGAYHVLVGSNVLALQREAEGEVEALQVAPYPISSDEWLQVGVAVTGDEHTVSVNGETALVATDPDPLPPGGIAFEVLDEAIGEFDDLTVTLRAESPPVATTPVPPVEAPPAAPGAPAYQSTPWVYTGGPIGGLGYDVRMRPDNPDVMFVTDAWAGVFKSVDGGETWFPTNTGITTRVGPSGDGIPVFSLTIDPNNPDRVWIGTQFSNSVFRSDDGGATWVPMNNGIMERAPTIRGFTVEPGNSDVVYLAGEVSSWEWHGEPLSGLGLDMTKGIVYKTTDGGQNWTRIWTGDNLARYIWIHPQNHDLIYVSTGIFDREAANSNADTGEPGGVGILRSHDGGATWEVLNEANGLNSDELYFGSLFMHPGNPDILLAAAGNDPYTYYLGRPLGGIYLTEDGGDFWIEVLDGHDFEAVEFCEGDPNVAYAAALDGFYRSDDIGHTWQELAGMHWGPPGVVAGFPIDMQCDPRDANRVFVNAYGGGNFLSEDGGQTWRVASKGYTGALMRQVVVAGDNPALVYASARSGIFVSTDGGEHWQGMSRGAARALETFGLAIDPQNSQHVIAVIGDAGPVPKVTFDGGQTWHEANPGLWDAGLRGPGDLAIQIAFAPTDPQRVLAIPGDYDCWSMARCENGRGVIFSLDGGETWAQSSLATGMALDLAFAPSDEANVYVAVYPGDLYRSMDGGQTWELIAEGITSGIRFQDPDPDMPRPALTALAVDPTDPNQLYAGFFRGGVMISHDGGATWEIASSGLAPETSVRDLVADAAHPGVIYAAMHDSGVSFSTDSGATWTPINVGLITRAALDLSLSADGSVLYLATEGGGVFRLGTPPESLPAPAVTAAPLPTPTHVAAAPTSTPPPAQPTALLEVAPSPTPVSPEGLGICGGVAALPLGLLGLVWVNRRRR